MNREADVAAPEINLVVVQVAVASVGISVPIFWAYAVAQSGNDGGSGILFLYLSMFVALGVSVLAARRKVALAERIKSFVAHVFIYLAALLLVGGGLFMLMVR